MRRRPLSLLLCFTLLAASAWSLPAQDRVSHAVPATSLVRLEAPQVTGSGPSVITIEQLGPRSQPAAAGNQVAPASHSDIKRAEPILVEPSQPQNSPWSPLVKPRDAATQQTLGGGALLGDTQQPSGASVQQPYEVPLSHGPNISLDLSLRGGRSAPNAIDGGDPFAPIPYGAADAEPFDPTKAAADMQGAANAHGITMTPPAEAHPSPGSGDRIAAAAKRTGAAKESQSWLQWLGIPTDLTIIGILGTLAAIVALGMLGQSIKTPVTNAAEPAVEVPTMVQDDEVIDNHTENTSELDTLTVLINNELPLVEESCDYKPNLTFYGRTTTARLKGRIGTGHTSGLPETPDRPQLKTEQTVASERAPSESNGRRTQIHASHSGPPAPGASAKAGSGRGQLLDRVLSNIRGVEQS